MRVFVGLVVLAATALLVFGTPLPTKRPVLEHRWRSPEPILPMTFAHEDHVAENCLVCHHNYVDNTGNDPCMICHVINQEVWPMFESQFHDLCRSCHEDRQLAGEDHGPTRVCVDCHIEEDRA